jgi:hypothetical protein
VIKSLRLRGWESVKPKLNVSLSLRGADNLSDLLEAEREISPGAIGPHASLNTGFLAQRASLSNHFTFYIRYRMRQEMILLTSSGVLKILSNLSVVAARDFSSPKPNKNDQTKRRKQQSIRAIRPRI